MEFVVVLKDVFNFIGIYIFCYPLIMSLVWLTGGVLFFFTREESLTKFPCDFVPLTEEEYGLKKRLEALRGDEIPLLPYHDRVDALELQEKIKKFPFVSVFITAHNNGPQIAETTEAVIESRYPNLEIILIDDGSTDNTPEILDRLSETYENTKVLRLEQDMSKGSGLNEAFRMSCGEVIVVPEAGCILEQQAIYWLVRDFSVFQRVGAVTGSLRARNRATILSQLQDIEFVSVLGLAQRTQRVPGTVAAATGYLISAFRREALTDVGLWSFDMLAENIDITWKLAEKFWEIRYEPNAVVRMLVPETLSSLWRQRVRRAQLGGEVLRRHKHIWTAWRQRRLWPAYIDSICGILWDYAFFAVMIYLVLGTVLRADIGSIEHWNVCVILAVCIAQIFVSTKICLPGNGTLFPAYFWLVWCPVIWVLNSFATVVGVPQGMVTGKKR